jgi:hypothetical protein
MRLCGCVLVDRKKAVLDKGTWTTLSASQLESTPRGTDSKHTNYLPDAMLAWWRGGGGGTRPTSPSQGPLRVSVVDITGTQNN